MKKKIINILFNDFTNDNRVLKESVSLINGGYTVELIATKFDKKLKDTENIKGINVKRVTVGAITFLPLNLFLFWVKVIIKYRDENVFHCNDLYALPPAYVIKKFFNKEVKIVYDCHEHETEAGIYIGKPILKKFAQIMERLIISSVDRVITVSDSIAEDYIDMYEIKKPYLVLNCPPYKAYSRKNLFREKFDIGKDKILFLYQGEYLKGRGVDKLINIFKDLEDKNENLALILLVYGDNLKELKENIQGCSNIYWHDKVSKEVYMNYVVSCDWGIYLMENTCKNHDYALPNKLFDYVMGNIPIVVSNLKEMSRFVENYKLGYTIDPDDYDAIINLLKGIDISTKEKYINNLKNASKEYSWEEQEKVLIKVYNSLKI
jgi:glycosyltransferase involved in cell wall biosynthesis